MLNYKNIKYKGCVKLIELVVNLYKFYLLKYILN